MSRIIRRPGDPVFHEATCEHCKAVVSFEDREVKQVLQRGGTVANTTAQMTPDYQLRCPACSKNISLGTHYAVQSSEGAGHQRPVTT